MEQKMASALPLITAVVSTRNRDDRVVRTIRSILDNDYPHFKIIVVDQSQDGSTESSLKPFQADPCFYYIRSDTEGISAGRNLGVSKAQSEIIAFTDDDCEASPQWLSELVAAFLSDDRIGIVFGNSLPGRYDRRLGFIPAFVRREPFLTNRIDQMHHINGSGACMGIRKSLWHLLGGFDEALGVGAPFQSAEEMDFTFRALLANGFVYEVPEVMVVHHGFRTWEQGKTLIQSYLYGIGAMIVKHLKCGHWAVIYLLFHLAWRWAFGRPVVDFGHRPSKILRLRAFINGFWAGAIHPVDRAKGLFRDRKKR